MTIRSAIDAAALNRDYTNFERCAASAPKGTYQDVKDTADMIGQFAEDLMLRAEALGFRPCDADGLREIEAVIYGWLRAGDKTGVTAVGEGFGADIDGPAGARITAQAERGRDLMLALGIGVGR